MSNWVVLYCLYALEQGYKYAVVRSPDSDILFILLYYASKFSPVEVLFDTGKGNHRRLINISELAVDLTERYCEALMALYCFTGEDSNCSFKGKGKVGPLKKLMKKQKYMDSFIKLGNDWEPDQETIAEIEEFTCFMYGYPHIKNIDKVRSVKIRKMTGGKDVTLKTVKKVDMSKLPPCRRSLLPHIRRVNYRVAQWKRSHLLAPAIPTPSEKHGWCQREQFLEPQWSDGPILPESLLHVLHKTTVEDSDSDNSDNSDSDREQIDSTFSSSSDSDID